MKTLKIKIRFTLNELFVALAMFCVVSYALLEHASISIPLMSLIKMPLVYLGGICILTQYRLLLKNVMKRKYFYVLLTFFVFCLTLIWSMYVNRNPDIGTSPVKKTVRLILYLVELLALVIILAETGKSMKMINCLFFYMVVLIIITDFLLLTGLVRFNPGKHENYFVGTKFSVAYLHINFLVMWVMRRQRMKKTLRLPVWRIIVLALLMLLISIRVNCMTGVMGCVALVGLFMLMETPRSIKLMRFSSPVILLLFFVGSVLASFIAEEIVSIPFVSYLIEDVLGRDPSLTGRLNIYLQYADRVKGHWLSGYGFGNGNAVSVALFHYENTQNAILQWVIQVGIPATCVLLFLMLRIFHQASFVNSKKLMEIMPLIVLVYLYVILGTVETTFSMSYIMWFAMIFMLINENRQEELAVEQAKGNLC